MIVTPQSNLQIMRGIPWTNDGKHTRYFTSVSDQNNYMQGHVIGTLQFADCSYIREQNVLRVPVKADDLYNCNYLRYMNNGFGSKWFYAFITDVKYVNTETSEISFEIDYFQTWWFDVQIGHCYVEREHVADDTIGLHIVEEDLGTGEIVPQVVIPRYWEYKPAPTPDTRKDNEKGMELMLQTKPTLLGQFCLNQQPFVYRDNQIVPQTVQKIEPISEADLNGDVMASSFSGAELGDGYMFPYEIMVANGQSITVNLDDVGIKRPSDFKYSQSISQNEDRRYTPKNNKLLTYPYTYLFVASSDGNKGTYRWENTKVGAVHFDLNGCGWNTPSCSLMPNNYLVDARSRLNDIPINDFPKVSLGTYDSINANNLLATGLKMVAGNPVSAFMELGKSVVGLATDTTDKDFATAGNTTLIKMGRIGYVFYVMCILGQNAEIIDNYFTRFGYKVNVIKIPELHSRKRWNYVKTKECEIHARDGHGAPTDALQKIQDMFNAGVTLWHVNSVGDFTGDNGIRS